MDSAEDGGVKLDPPEALVDNPIGSASMITTDYRASTTDAAQRCNSIGTLTSWQLLARQVGSGEDEDDKVPARRQASAVPEELLCSPRSASWSSGHGISPRPHHALYKEYRLLETIGKGAFGTVSIAVRRSDGKKLVAKEISQSQAALATAKQREAIMDEVNVLARMKHPNIVRYHDCFMDPNYLIILMEHCNAGDLAILIKKQAGQLMPEKHVMFLFVQILLAMHHVHAAGVLHRDLKTSNILAARPSGSATPGSSTPTAGSRRGTSHGHSSGGTPTAATEFDSLPLLKLADFGVAKAGCNTEGSMVGTTVGTPHYVSPEMCDGKRYGKKTDVWALGCILYEIACLKKAFEASNIGGIYRKIAAAEYTPLPDGFSSGLQDLVRSLLAKETKQRPSISETLNMPYVRQHLAQYLDWARYVPEAQPEVLLASISQSPDGMTSPKIPASRMGSQRLPASPLSHVSGAVPMGGANLRVGSNSSPGDAPGSGAQHGVAGQGMHTGSRPPALMLPQDASGSQSSGSPAVPPCSAPPSAAVMPAQQAAPKAVLDCVQQQQPAPCPAQHSAPSKPECRAVSMSSSGGAVQAASNSAGTAGQPPIISSALEAVPAKPNPLYAAAAALAEVPGLEAGPAFVGSAVSMGLGVLPHKKRLNVGGGSCSLDMWASANEPSSDLIAAFHNTGSNALLDCTSSGGPRRVSSAASSAAHTPRSPLGQYMHSWQQEQLQEYLQPAAQPPGKGTEQEPSSYRTTEETCLRTVPMPWLAAQAPDDPSRAAIADNWLATLVQSLKKLEHETNADLGEAAAVVVEAAAAAGKQPASTASVAAQPSSTAFEAWDPSMALMSTDNSAAKPRSNRTTGDQPPTSLQGWLGDDSSLLQMLQKCATRTSRTSASGALPSPLGAGAVPAKALSPGASFICPPGNSGCTVSKAEAIPAAASAAAVNPQKTPPVSLQDCVVVNSNPAAAALQASALPNHRCPGWQASVGNDAQQQQLNAVPYVTVLAGSGAEESEDDLPLALMVKQCLSGNSFVGNRSGNSVTSGMRSRACSVSGQTPQAVDRSAPVSRYDSGASQTTSGSNAAQQPLPNGGRQDSGQLADQAAARLLTEQQEVVSRFNAFRKTLGIYPGRTTDGNVTNLMHLQCMSEL